VANNSNPTNAKKQALNVFTKPSNDNLEWLAQ
jgi:hypothetical protein